MALNDRLSKFLPGMTPTSIQTTVALMLILSVVGCAETRGLGGAADDHNVLTGGPVAGTRIDDLPMAVRAVLAERAPHAEIADIDKTTRRGEEVYEISFREPGRNPKLYVTVGGNVLPNPDIPR